MTEQRINTPDQYYEQVAALATELFGDSLGPNGALLGMQDHDIVARSIPELLADPDNVLATTLVDGQVAGFSVAIPIAKMDPTRTETNTAYIYFTGIMPNLQGHGHVAAVNKTMIELLKERGYEFVERDCVIKGGYADNIEKQYKHAVIKQYDHTRWPEFGPERFFRIDLSKIDHH